VLAGSEFHTVKILRDENFFKYYKRFAVCIVCKRDLWHIYCVSDILYFVVTCKRPFGHSLLNKLTELISSK